MSHDLKKRFNTDSGFSSRNIRYMLRFYQLYELDSNLPQLVANLGLEICSLYLGDITN
ncbi:DUF1016 N-terminal domain-containing protein [Pseudobutyrivibrio sp. ACV-2]|uniref:DUF1016 N-terminal domain-containing protein n=1 Tax=Pseudobutyrivibrio sp. ACV-2 TaxID=1520801 RepID=UPI000B801A9B